MRVKGWHSRKLDNHFEDIFEWLVKAKAWGIKHARRVTMERKEYGLDDIAGERCQG